MEKIDFTNEFCNKDEISEDTKKEVEEEPRPEAPKIYPEVDTKVKSLIKSVAYEIQKSFSQRNLDMEQDEDEDDDDVDDDNENEEDVEEKGDKHEDTPKFQDAQLLIIPEEPSVEAPIDFDAVPVVLDTSIHREKVRIVRKSSRERRLPANIIAKKKAAEKLKELLSSSMKADDDDSKISKKLETLIDDPEGKSDEEKAELLAKEMSKLESNQILQILQSVEKGVLDFSIPLLIPFLSLQVKLSLGKHIYRELDTSNKTEIVKESIIDSLVNDITDIAILQEGFIFLQKCLRNNDFFFFFFF